MADEREFKTTDRRASAEASESAAEKGCGCGGKKDAESAHVMPKVTFSTFILSLSSTALVSLGEVPEPESGAFTENLPLAKHTIDILVMLKSKTERCLDPEEAQLLDGILYELRMKYVMKAG